jgi:hypothetical protein
MFLSSNCLGSDSGELQVEGEGSLEGDDDVEDIVQNKDEIQ